MLSLKTIFTYYQIWVSSYSNLFYLSPQLSIVWCLGKGDITKKMFLTNYLHKIFTIVVVCFDTLKTTFDFNFDF